jgi:Phage integrase family
VPIDSALTDPCGCRSRGAGDTHAHKFGWMPANIAAMLIGFKTANKQVQPFSKDQMTAILAAIPKCGWGSVKTQRIIALIQTMRWIGLAIQNAVCFKRSALDQQSRIRTARTKTKTPVAVLTPHAVAESLTALPEHKPGYFFTWMSPQKSQIGSDYRKIPLKVFGKAGIKDGHSHQFRHTFAVENLVAGMSWKMFRGCWATVRPLSQRNITLHGFPSDRQNWKPPSEVLGQTWSYQGGLLAVTVRTSVVEIKAERASHPKGSSSNQSLLREPYSLTVFVADTALPSILSTL